MPIDRIERVNALLRREIAEAIPTVMGNADIDTGAITVTQVRVARNLRNATVSVSILGHEKERSVILRKLAHSHAAFQRLINHDMNLKYTPVLRFTLDESIEKGDHILDILAKLTVDNPAAADEPSPAPGNE